MLQQEISAFGRRMGMPGLALSAGGLLALDVAGMGRLHIETGTDELLVYLSRAIPSHDSEAPRRLLELSHYRHAHAMPLQGGVHAGHAILLTRLALRAVSAAALENAALFLARLMDDAAANGGRA